MARPKGQRFFPMTVSMAPEERTWVDAQPVSRSDYVRELIRRDMASAEGEAAKGEVSLASLIKRRDDLADQRARLINRRADIEWDHPLYWLKDEHGNTVTDEGRLPKVADPRNRAAAIARARLKVIDEEIPKLSARIKEAEDDILKRSP